MALYRIRKPRVRKLALVKRGANGNTWHLLKSAPAPGEIVKADGDDWHVAYIVVAEPGKVEGGGIAKDGQAVTDSGGEEIQDVWDEDSIREAAHSFAANGGLTVDAHFTDGQTLGRWAESYIAPVDHHIGGRPIKAGSWVLGIKPTDEGRKAIKDGRVRSVSIEGDAERVPVVKTDEAEALFNKSEHERSPSRWENPPWRAELEAQVAELEANAANANGRRVREALAKLDPPEVGAARERARLAKQAERKELRDRIAGGNGEMSSADVDATTDIVMALGAADPTANRPSWSPGWQLVPRPGT